MMKLYAIVLVLLTITLTTVSAATVEIRGKGFFPKELNVTVGEEITWKNLEDRIHVLATKGPHFLEISSPVLFANSSYSHTFRKAGTFYYYDTQYGYQGTITVTEKTEEKTEPENEQAGLVEEPPETVEDTTVEESNTGGGEYAGEPVQELSYDEPMFAGQEEQQGSVKLVVFLMLLVIVFVVMAVVGMRLSRRASNK